MERTEDSLGVDHPMLENSVKQNGRNNSRTPMMIRGKEVPPNCASVSVWIHLGAILYCKCLRWSKDNLLLLMTVIAVVLGVLLGFVCRLAEPSDMAILMINFPGDLLIRMLKMLIIPLIVSSLISGLAKLNPKSCGKMGSKALLYYFGTTFCAIIVGISLVVAIHPGNPEVKKTADRDETNTDEVRIDTEDAFLDLIRNMFPENLIQACFAQVRTRYREKTILPELEAPVNMTNASTLAAILNVTNTTSMAPQKKIIRYLVMIDGMNVLGLIVFCIGFGVVLSRVSERTPLMVKFFDELSEIIMYLVEIIMWYSPIGIMFLIIGNIVAIPSLEKVAVTLGLYMITVLLGLIIHTLGTLCLIYFLFTRKNPFIFMKGMLQAWLTALGTSSSAATLPVTFRCLEENNHVDKRVTRFVLPVGATVNMDGTALYEAVAAIFIAQLNDIPLSFGEICTISMTATLASIGAASIPSAGLVTLVMVLMASGLPPEDIGIIFTVDWLLDRCRTSVNVLGDAFGAGIVYHLSRADLEAEDEAHAAALAATENSNEVYHKHQDDTHI